MAKAGYKNGISPRVAAPSKYDAHNTVLDKTYGAFADLRRELSDSKTSVAERSELLNHYANHSRLAELQQAEQDEVIVQELESWLAPKIPAVLDGPRAALRMIGRVEPVEGQPGLHRFGVEFIVSRLRTGEKVKGLPEMLE